MAKKIQAIVKLQIEGGAATAAPPVGPALGQHGANIMAFVKEYNEKTASMKGDVIPVEITIFQDKSFTFELKSPPAAALILKALSVDLIALRKDISASCIFPRSFCIVPILLCPTDQFGFNSIVFLSNNSASLNFPWFFKMRP